MSLPRLIATAALLALPLPALNAGADEEWKRLEALESAPQTPARSPEAARAAALERLTRQERALRDFLAAHPADARAHDARLRLAHVLSLRGDMAGDTGASGEAARILEAIQRDEAETAPHRADAAFASLVIDIRRARTAGAIDREDLLTAARGFQSTWPRDNRAGGLLAEIASLFDDAPRRKLDILRDAQSSATDPELRLRIADDLRRLGLLGRKLPIEFTSTNGQAIDDATLRGKVVVVYFFAGWSAPALHEIDRVRQAVLKFPAARVQALGVSLDTERAALDRILRAQHIEWPVRFDGKGWESPFVRSLAINALPTTFVLDRQGKLRAINPRDELESTLGALIRER